MLFLIYAPYKPQLGESMDVLGACFQLRMIDTNKEIIQRLKKLIENSILILPSK